MSPSPANNNVSELQVLARMRSRNAPVSRKYPPRQRAIVWPQQPPLTGGRVAKCKLGSRRPSQQLEPADLLEKGERAAIAGKQQVIAVVDREAKRRFEVGAAPPARMTRQLVHDDVTILCDELYSGGQSGKSGADNVGRAARH